MFAELRSWFEARLIASVICLALSLTIYWPIYSQETTDPSWMEAGDAAPFAGKLLTMEQYSDLLALAVAGREYRTAWGTGTELLTECKVTLARLEVSQRNKLVDTGKNLLIGGLGIWLASSLGGKSCPAQ